jgi:hypothetical protein
VYAPFVSRAGAGANASGLQPHRRDSPRDLGGNAGPAERKGAFGGAILSTDGVGSVGVWRYAVDRSIVGR